MKNVNPDKYRGLVISPYAKELLKNDPQSFAAMCNGVGSEVGNWWQRLLYKITPNTIWGLDITPASDIHDVEYTVPDTFPSRRIAETWRHEADSRFLHNIFALADQGWMLFRQQRKIRAMAYYRLLRLYGEDSFYQNKTIEGV